MKKTALMILVTALWLAVFCGEAAAGEPIHVTNANFGEKIAGIANSPETDFVFILDDNIKVNGISITRPGVTVTILGNNHELDIQGGWIQVEGDENQKAVLNLGKPGYKETLTIRGAKRNDNPGALYIQNNSVYNMYDGVTIKDITNSNYFGGGVSVQGGTFNMYGGTISNCKVEDGSVCYGGGVAVYCNGIFNMHKGTISNCRAEITYPTKSLCPSGTGGGVYVGNRAAFNMYGGTITNCYASMHGGGVMVQNSKKSLNENNNWNGYLDSRFEMIGGSIEKCTAAQFGGGIAVLGTYDVADPIGEIQKNHSDRHPIMNKIGDPGVSISNGTIKENSAIYGGGVFIIYLRSHIRARIENTTIVNNTASSIGGGIGVLKDWTNLFIDGCTITGNTSYIGGGLGVQGSNQEKGETIETSLSKATHTTVTNTKLCNNTATYGSDVSSYMAPMTLPDADGMGQYNRAVPNNVTGKIIDGWYYDDGAGYLQGQYEEYDGYASIPLDPYEGFYLIAAVNPDPITVTFDANGHGTAPAKQENLTSGDKVSNPGKCTDTDYVFTGWYKDKACTIPYDFNSRVTRNMTLYACWKPKYTLHYGDGRPHDGEWGYNYKEPGEEGYYDPALPEELPTEVRYFSEAEVNSNKYEGVVSEGHYFLAWSRSDAEGLHIELQTPDRDCGNIEYYAHWLKVTVDVKVDISTKDVTIEDEQKQVVIDDSQKEALSKNVNPETDFLGNNCEINIIMTVKDENLPADELASADTMLKSVFGSIPKNSRLDYDVSVLKIITVDGREKVRAQLKELAAPIEITFAIPVEWRTGGKVHVFRTHTKDGVTNTVELETLHRSEETCTVVTDEFSIYTLVFEPDQAAANELPKTGDSSSLPLLLGITLLACLGIVLLVRRKR